MLTGLHTCLDYHCSTQFDSPVMHVYSTSNTVILNYKILDFIRRNVVQLYLTRLWFPLVERAREGDTLRGRARGDALRQRARGNALRRRARGNTLRRCARGEGRRVKATHEGGRVEGAREGARVEATR
jgi:hypothetical protein